MKQCASSVCESCARACIAEWLTRETALKNINNAVELPKICGRDVSEGRIPLWPISKQGGMCILIQLVASPHAVSYTF